jgi:hypothetical protein
LERRRSQRKRPFDQLPGEEDGERPIAENGLGKGEGVCTPLLERKAPAKLRE